MGLFEEQNRMAEEILTRHRGKVLAIVKATRAGATFSLLKKACELGQKTVIVAPYIPIFDQTVKEVEDSFDTNKPRVARIARNEDDCKKVAERIEQYQSLRSLPFHHRPSCKGCEYNDPSICRLQEILASEWDILGLTYAKLRALSVSESETAMDLLEKVGESDNLILDEFVTGIVATSPSIEIEEPHEYLLREFDYSRRMVPSHGDTIEGEFWPSIGNLALVSEVKGKGLAEGELGFFDNPTKDEFGTFFEDNFAKCWKLVERLTIEGKSTKVLQQLLQIVNSNKFFIIKKSGKVSLMPVLDLADATRGSHYLVDFVHRFRERDKMIALIDACLPDLDLEKTLGVSLTAFRWGDPLCTNETQLVVCDTRKISKINFFKSMRLQEQVKETVNSLCELHGAKTVLIATQGKDMHDVLKLWQGSKQIPEDVIVTYYRSDISRGITAPARSILVLIGGPYLPNEAYLPETYTSTNQASLQTAFKNSDMKSAFINLIGRVKDAKGREPSIVYALGMLSDEVNSFLRKDVSKPFIVGFPVQGADTADFKNVARLFLETPRERWENAQDIAIVARLIRKCRESASATLACWKIVPNQTERVQQIIENYRDILSRYGIRIEQKSRGLSLVYSRN